MPIALSRSRTEFFRLVARGAGLELVTVGFYRFWLTTDIRRHLWSNTQIDGDAPEYTGRGKELLIGFLVALAILVPDLSRLFPGRHRGRASQGVRLAAAGRLLLCVRPVRDLPRAALPADPHGVARRPLLDERLGLDLCARRPRYGASWCVMTLGFALPWREAALERYKMRHSYYGDLQGSFEGRGWEFFKRGWWLWLLMPFALYVLRVCTVRVSLRSRRSSGVGGCRASASARCRLESTTQPQRR